MIFEGTKKSIFFGLGLTRAGESFPDIGVLESLSHLLELPIQDIVIGESAADQENAVTELVRLVKLQEQRKREKYRLLMERTVLHPGCVISPAVIYLDFFYIDILGRMDTLDSVWKALDRGTVLILLEAVLGIVFLFIQSRCSHSHASDSLRRSL